MLQDDYVMNIFKRLQRKFFYEGQPNFLEEMRPLYIYNVSVFENNFLEFLDKFQKIINKVPSKRKFFVIDTLRINYNKYRQITPAISEENSEEI